MTPERWAKLRSIFNRAVECEGAARLAVLDSACGSDMNLRREIEEMLAFDAGSEERLRHAIGGAVTEAVQGEHSRLIGTTIGSYRIKGVLGYGGMGTVYDAERADDAYKQRVAIKLVQQMAVHPQLRTRLRAERQILANLDHPYIARLIDGGETGNGVPYLVIEFVDGQPIDRYCDTHKLGVHERLALFEKVCSAVDYAHRNLVVHRDLKPVNILVTADGTPKLLDFGIAKLLNPDPAWNTVAVTRVQDRLLTPEHASPEQVLGRAITTASDVYALGVLLYALLCGRSPYALKNSTPRALERAICNEDPPRPSSLFRGVRDHARPAEDGFDPRLVAENRGVTPQRLSRQLAGDIDEVILKAMRKEPEQRYATAYQLGDELRRHRMGEAVVARQRVRRYRVAKFLQRNALTVGMVGVVMVALATFASFMWMQSKQVAKERDRAALERDRAEEVSKLLINVFSEADPYKTQGHEYTATELLERGAQSIDANTELQPEVRARMLESIGYAMQRQDKYAQAAGLLEQALQIRRQAAAENPSIANLKLLATNYKNLADALREAGQTTTSEYHYREALKLSEQLRAEEPTRLAGVMVGLARLTQKNQTRVKEAEELFKKALTIYEQELGENHTEVASVLSDLASLEIWNGDLANAEQHQLKALNIYRQHLPRTHPDHATALAALGQIYTRRGNLIDGERLIMESLELHREVFGENNPRISELLALMADVRERQGRTSEAIAYFEQALELARKIGAGSGWRAGYFEDSIASLNFKSGRLSAAEEHVRAALSIYRQLASGDTLYVASSEHLLGEILLAQGKPADAATALRESIAICMKVDGMESWRTARSLSVLGMALAELDQPSEAESYLVQAHQILLRTVGSTDEKTRAARKRLLVFLRAQHREAEAQLLLGPSTGDVN
jgi:serine/threonine protein kinase